MRPARLTGLLTSLFCVFCLSGCPRNPKPDDPVGDMVHKGDRLLELDNYAAADAEYAAAMLHTRDDPRVISRLGRLAYRQGRVLSAYFFLQGSIDRVEQESPDLLLIYGLANHALGKRNEARRIAKTVLERLPDNEEALILLVETGFSTPDNREARRIVEELQSRVGERAAFHVALGMLENAEGRPEQAEAELRAALHLEPRSAAAHSQLGSLLLAQGKQSEGAAALKEAAALSPYRSHRRINYIDYLIRTGQHDQAYQELSLIKTKTPDYVPAWVTTMKLDFLLGKFDDSRAAAEKALSLDRINYDAWMQRAAIRLQQGDLAGVISDLRRVESYYSKSPEVKYQLALALWQKGEIYSAEQNVDEALRLMPTYEEAVILRAQIDLAKDNTSGSRAALRSLLDRNPQNAQAYALLAQVYNANDESERALEVLKSFAERYPNRPIGPHLTGLTLLRLDQGKAARQSFEKALTLSPDYWPSLEMLVDMDLLESKRDAAMDRIEAAMRSHPTATPPLLLRGKLKLMLKDLPGAEADFAKAIELDPRMPQPYLMLARIYFETGRAAQSIERLNALVSQQPSPNVLLQLGVLQTMQGDRAKAIAAYEQALVLDPNFIPALNNLALLYADMGSDLEKASALIKRARENSKEPMLTDTAGWILVRQGQLDSGLRLLQTAAESLPSDPEVRFHLGMAHYYLGQEENARQALQAAVASSPGANFEKDAQRRLAILAITPGTGTPAVRQQLEDAIRVDTQDAAALYRLALLRHNAGDFRGAAETYEALHKVNPRNLTAIKALAALYFGPFKNLDRARELTKIARDVAPNDAEFTWRLGKWLFQYEDFPWANALLQDAARLLPDNREVQFDFALAQYSLGRVAEAEAILARLAAPNADSALDQSIARQTRMLAAARTSADDAGPEADRILKDEPNDVAALMVKARLLEKNGSHQAAATQYEKILNIYPQFVPAMRHLAVLAADHFNDGTRASEWATRVLRQVPDDPEANYIQGVVAYRTESYETALGFLRQAIRQRGDHGLSQFFLGMTLYRLTNSNEARIALEKAVQLPLPPQEASEARRTLELVERRSRY